MRKIYKSSILLFLYLIKIATGKYRMFTFRKPFFCVVVWNAFKGEGLILSQKSCPSQNYNFQWNVWSMIKTIANHSSACTKPIGPVGPGHIFGGSLVYFINGGFAWCTLLRLFISYNSEEMIYIWEFKENFHLYHHLNEDIVFMSWRYDLPSK